MAAKQLEKVALFTNEYPPNVYGGAGVHVEYLSRELAKLIAVEVRCFGDQRRRRGQPERPRLPRWDAIKQNTDPRFAGALDAFARNLAMVKDTLDADIVHCHTWYTDHGRLPGQEALGRAARADDPLAGAAAAVEGRATRRRLRCQSWMERTAHRGGRRHHRCLAGDARDVLRSSTSTPERVHVIHNGIDLDEYRPDAAADALVRLRRRPDRPYVLFVGRITRQKGIIHLVNAIPQIDPALQIVLCAGAPDTPEIGAEMATARRRGQRRPAATSSGSRRCCRAQESSSSTRHAAVFCCPSVYEPFGIINLEAMACETAVVASAIGGIPEVVVPVRRACWFRWSSSPARSSRPTRRASPATSRPPSTPSPSTLRTRPLRPRRPPPRRTALLLGRHRRSDAGALSSTSHIIRTRETSRCRRHGFGRRGDASRRCESGGAIVRESPESAGPCDVAQAGSGGVSMFSIVIVPLDGSTLAEQALPWAEALANASQAPLQLLQVAEPDKSDEPARAYLESVAGRLSREAETSVRHGRPATEVIAAVREHDDPIVVLTTRGYTGMDAARVGSVADQVVHAVTAPVLLIRAGMEHAHNPPIRSILVTLDGSDFAESALTYAMRLAEAMQASLRLVRVVETQRLHGMLAGGSYMSTSVGPLGDVYQAAVEQAQHDAETYLANVAQRLQGTGIPIETTLLAGMPDEAIQLAEQRYQPDLVVMASHGRGGANWLVFGSIAERVLKLGSAPLLVIKPLRPADDQQTTSATVR